MDNDLTFRTLLRNRRDLLLQDPHVIDVLMDIRTVAVDNGAGNRESDGIVIPESHDLDVLPYCRELFPEFLIDKVRRVPDDGLDFREGGMPDTEGGVV